VLDDCFTTSLEPGIVDDVCGVLDAFGWRVERVSLAGCCGRPQFSSGLLREARALVERSAPRLLADLDAIGATALIVAEPSCLSAITADWPDLVTDVPDDTLAALASRAMSIDVFLDQRWDDHPRRPEMQFPTGTVVHPHCHEKVGRATMARLLERLGAADACVLDSGCCGLAGSFGYLAENAALTRTIFRQSLGDRLDASRPDMLVAAGTSCRHQCADLGGHHAIHPATLLARAARLRREQESRRAGDRGRLRREQKSR
jgi:Fe-S oxidoreductase